MESILDPKVRKQAVKIEMRISSLLPMVIEAPQWTVLFLVFIRGINSYISSGTSLSSFADNTRKTASSSTQNIYTWVENINMEFNSQNFEWVMYPGKNLGSEY